MPFLNGSATGPVDLLQQLNTFLTAHGWNSDMTEVDGVGWRVHIDRGGVFAHLRAQVNEPEPFQDNGGANGYSVCLYLGSAFTSANAWNNQVTGAPLESATPTKPVGVGMRLTAAAIPNYWFFADTAGDNVVVVVENSSGIFNHLGFGVSLSKVGAYTGGAYFFGVWDGCNCHQATGQPGDASTITANCPGCTNDPYAGATWFVRADVDSFVGKWICGSDTTTDQNGYTGKNGIGPVGGVGTLQHTQIPSYYETYGEPGDFQAEQVSAIDGRANLLPIPFYVQRDGVGAGYSMLGSLPLVFVCSGVGQGYSPGSTYVLGATTYTVFPMFSVITE